MAIVERIRKDGQVGYQPRVKDASGKWYPSQVHSNKRDAEDAEQALIKQKRRGAKVITDDARTISVEEYWDVWSVENRTDVSDGWKMSQDQMARDYVLPVIGSMRMIEVKTPEIGRILNRAKGMGRGAQTRKHVYSLLRKMFGDAVEYYEMLTANPVRAKFHRPKVGERKRDFLTPPEALELLKASKDHFLGPAVWLQLLSGLRPSEVQGLLWGAVQLDLGQIVIRSAFNKKTRTMQKFPKQDDWGMAPIPTLLSDYLKLMIGPEMGLVSPGPKGGVLSYETYLPGLKRLCKKAGVPEVTPHELRHSASEIYVQAGASAEDLRRLLNHSSLSATKHYIHRTDERLNRIAGNVSGTLSLIPGGKSFPNGFPNGKQEAGSASDTDVQNVR